MDRLLELIDKAKDGEITNSDAEFAYQRILNDDPELISYLYVLGRSFREEYEELFKQFLIGSNDEAKELAIDILCNYWDKMLEYYKIIFGYANNVDETLDIRKASINAISYNIKKKVFPECDYTRILGELLRWYEETDDMQIREECYRGLAFAYGKQWKDIFGSRIHEIDNEILKWAKKRVSSETEE